MLTVLFTLAAIVYAAGVGFSIYKGHMTVNPVEIVHMIKGDYNGNGEGNLAGNSDDPLKKPEAADESEAESVSEEATEAPTEEVTEAPTESETSTEEETTETENETTTEKETEKIKNLATIYVDADIPVKIRSNAFIPVGDKEANILAEVSSEARLQVQVVKKKAGESNGYKWSKIKIIKTLKNSDGVAVKTQSGKLKKGTICYVVTNYLQMEEE